LTAAPIAASADGWPGRGEIEVRDEPPVDWDSHTVTLPGGHVYQSLAWAEHRRRFGWRPRFVVFPGSIGILVLTRPWPVIGGSSAYVPRGPIPVGDTSEMVKRLGLIRTHFEDVDVMAIDPEVPAADDFGRRIIALGYRPIEEIQPSRHRMTLPLAGRDEDGVWSGIAKSTRQRIRKAEGSVAVVRHDILAADAAGEGFASPIEPAATALDRFYELLLATGERRHFGFGPREDFVGWWCAAHEAGHLVYLEARDEDARGDALAGLILYRHGQRLSTVHSADRADSRHTHPGALHLLRWRAIQLALREGRNEMDLGGADVAGARRVPREGEPMYGLYEHKKSFGATWLELVGAHERVFRPQRYAVGRVLQRLTRIGRRPGRAA
jgi:peptidoglycan pentaglycine glycine transferase (the first glycine)